MKDIHLNLDHLAVGYHGKALIHGIEIGVRRGEIVTLVGPNGSGKSTILKTITRQLTPVSGEILLAEHRRDSLPSGNKKPPRSVPDSDTEACYGGKETHSELKKLGQFSPAELAKEMAVMLTGRLQTELMTCRDVAAMGRYPYTGRLGILHDTDEQKVDEALAAVHAEHLSNRPFDAVSDGERQRILLARAICQEPDIIILDEPTSYLDIRHKLELLEILHKMSREQGITVVMSLHEIDLAMKISDRIICVKGEEIFACGKPSEILDDETVRKLYDLDAELGRFNTRTGSLELFFAEKAPAEMLQPPRNAILKNAPTEEPQAPRNTVSEKEFSAEQKRESGEKTDTAFTPAPAQDTGQKQSLSIPRVMIAAPGSGSGKTLITCGLLRLLQRKKLRPAAFKCGPDYIDPMFHKQVLGIPSRNLDTFFSPEDSAICGNTAKETMERAIRRNRADIAVIEGVMGYFDGTGASGMGASSCDLARQTDTPVILVVNAKGMSRSIVPLLKGFAEYEEKTDNSIASAHKDSDESKKGSRRITGVILNRISAGMFPMMKKWIEEDTCLKVIGYVPQETSISWGSRHLGLLQPEEVTDLQDQIDRLADIMDKTIDQDVLLEVADNASPLIVSAESTDGLTADECDQDNAVYDSYSCNGPQNGPCIAVARDEAFSFYYEDNLELLQELGAQLVFFSPIHDEKIPQADGLLIGGGYPELYAKELAHNESMKARIRELADRGMPILAECGGFMYLQQSLETVKKDPVKNSEDASGQGFTNTSRKDPAKVSAEKTGQNGALETCFEMCGVLPGSCRMTDKLVRFGYIELEKKDGDAGTAGYLRDGHYIRGHEFHYFDSTENGDACTARKPGRRRSWDCMVVQGSIMAGFPHLYYRSDPDFAAAFVEKCRQFSKIQNNH